MLIHVNSLRMTNIVKKYVENISGVPSGNQTWQLKPVLYIYIHIILLYVGDFPSKVARQLCAKLDVLDSLEVNLVLF